MNEYQELDRRRVVEYFDKQERDMFAEELKKRLFDMYPKPQIKNFEVTYDLDNKDSREISIHFSLGPVLLDD